MPDLPFNIAAEFTGPVAGVVDTAQGFFDDIRSKSIDINVVGFFVFRQQQLVKLSGDQPQMLRLQRSENQDLMSEFSKTGDKFRTEPFFKLHFKVLLQASFRKMFDILKDLCPDITGGNDKKFAQVIGFIVAERNSCGIQLLKHDGKDGRV